jgi:hypothetical protein
LRLALLWNISEGEPVIIWAHGILFIPVFADYCVVVVAMPPRRHVRRFPYDSIL